MKLKWVLTILLVFSLSVFAEGYKKAPAFKLKNLKGKSVELSKALEKGPVLIDFWASWCEPCKAEMPIFNELHKKYSKKGLSMYMITIDKGSGISKAKSYVKSKGFKFDVLLDKGKKVFKKFGGKSSVPLTFIINKKGEIVFRHSGEGTKKMFEDEIKKVLK